MSRPPFCYDEINVIASGKASPNISCADTNVYWYWKRMLFQRAMSVFKPTLPETWAENYVNNCLWGIGYYAVFNTAKFGVIPSWCTIGGWTVQYQPKWAIIANPAFKRQYRLDIDRQCVLIRLCPDYGGIMDTVDYYANMLSLATETASLNIYNSHTSYVFGAANKGSAQTFKKMYDNISRGEPAVVVDKQFFDTNGDPTWTKFDNDLKNNYIASDLLDDIRKIVNMFDTELGIPNNATDKKERQIKDEVNANNVETYTKMDMFLDTVKKQCKKARDMFGINLDYNWRFPPATMNEGSVGNENRNSVNTGNV